MKKFLFSFLIILFLFSACGDSKNPYSPLPLQKAQVQISIDSLVIVIQDDEYIIAYNLVLSEHNGVAVTITKIELQYYFKDVLLFTDVSTDVRSLSANGKVEIPILVYADEPFDKLVVTVTGKDSNGHTIIVSQTFT